MTDLDVSVLQIPGHVMIPDLDGFQGTVDELSLRLNALAHVYGRDAIITFDAGHNNIIAAVISQASVKAYLDSQKSKNERKFAKKREKLESKIADLQRELNDLK